MSTGSQREQIRQHLLAHGSITKLEGLRDYGCMNTGGRVWELKQEGMPIKTVMIACGNGKRCAAYTCMGPQQLALFGEAV